MKNDQDQVEALGLLQASVTCLEGKLQSAQEAFQQVQDSAMLPVQKVLANQDPKLCTHFITIAHFQTQIHTIDLGLGMWHHNDSTDSGSCYCVQRNLSCSSNWLDSGFHKLSEYLNRIVPTSHFIPFRICLMHLWIAS